MTSLDTQTDEEARGQPSPYSDDSGRPGDRDDGSTLAGEHRDRIAGHAVVFVNTLHTGQGIVDALLLLMDAVEGAGMLDLSVPAGGPGAEYIRKVVEGRGHPSVTPAEQHGEFVPLDGFGGQHMRNIRGWQSEDGSA